MAATDKYDWDLQLYRLWTIIQGKKANKEKITFYGLAEDMDIPVSTITSALKRVHGLTRLQDVIDQLY